MKHRDECAILEENIALLLTKPITHLLVVWRLGCRPLPTLPRCAARCLQSANKTLPTNDVSIGRKPPQHPHPSRFPMVSRLVCYFLSTLSSPSPPFPPITRASATVTRSSYGSISQLGKTDTQRLLHIDSHAPKAIPTGPHIPHQNDPPVVLFLVLRNWSSRTVCRPLSRKTAYVMQQLDNQATGPFSLIL